MLDMPNPAILVEDLLQIISKAGEKTLAQFAEQKAKLDQYNIDLSNTYTIAPCVLDAQAKADRLY